MIAIDLSKQQTLDADPKAMQQINFTVILNRSKNNDGQHVNDDSIIFFINEEAKETILDFWKGTVKVNLFYFELISV